MRPSAPSRSASLRVAKATRVTGHNGRHGASRTSAYLLSRFAYAAMAVVLAASILTGLTAIFTNVSAEASPYQDWPMFLQNPARTAATVDPKLSVSSASTLKLKFTFAAGGPIASSVSIVGTTAYFGSWDGYEYAVNTQTGALIWKQNLGTTTDPGCNPVNNGVTSSPAIVNGVLYVGGGGPYWYALDPTTGNILWKVYTGDNSQAGAHYNWSSPLIVGNYAYIGIASNCDNPLVQGQLLQVAISGAQQGQIVNSYSFVPNGEVGGGVWTTPTYDSATNTIFVSTGTLNDHTQTQSQAIVALNATTLQYRAPGSCRSRPRSSTPTGGPLLPLRPTRLGISCCRSPTRMASCTPSTGTTWRPDRSGSTRSRSAGTAPPAGTGRSRPASSRTASCTTRAAATSRTATGPADPSPHSTRARAASCGAGRPRGRSWALPPTSTE